MTSAQYYEFLEECAAAHVLVKHTPTEPHYFRGELEEFFRDLRNRVHFPALIAESYETQYYDNRKIREGGFIVVKNYPSAKNWEEIYEALDLCERIGDEMLRRIDDAALNGELCADFQPLTASPLLNEQHLYAGVRYTFQLSEPFASEYNPDMWLV